MSEVARHDRRKALLRVLGNEWYEWLGEAIAVGLIAAVAVGQLPTWSLIVATLLLLRPLSRLVVAVMRGVLDAAGP